MIVSLGLGALLAQSPLDIVLQDPALQGAVVGVVVMDPKGTVRYDRNGDVRMVPASNQKLLTGAFALHRLPANQRFETRFHADSRGVWIDAPGDPLMTRDDLREIRRRLGRYAGRRVYVRPSFDVKWPDSWEWDDLPYYYAPVVSSFTVDRGVYRVESDGKQLRLSPEGYGDAVRRVTGPRETYRYLDARREWVISTPSFPNAGPGQRLAIPDPLAAAASTLGRYAGRTRDPLPGAPILTWTGRTVADAVIECLPPSDNYLAEALFLAAARQDAATIDYPSARREMGRFLTEVVGVAAGDFRISDGSGLSRQNFVTPRAMAQLLHWAETQPFAAQWEAAQARPGSGTLRNQLSGIDFAGKTGTLSGVVSLSGYVRARSGERFRVVCIANHTVVPAAQVRAVWERVMRLVADDQVPRVGD